MNKKDRRNNLKIGEKVLVMNPFMRFGRNRWYIDETFKIAKIHDTNRPVVYGLADEAGNPVMGRWNLF